MDQQGPHKTPTKGNLKPCTSLVITPYAHAIWRPRVWIVALQIKTCWSRWPLSWTWDRNELLQQRKPTASWATLGRESPASWSFPSTQPWSAQIWSAVSAAGLHSAWEAQTHWIKLSKEPQRWLKNCSISHMGKGWELEQSSLERALGGLGQHIWITDGGSKEDRQTLAVVQWQDKMQ